MTTLKSSSGMKDLLRHVGHKISCVSYGLGNTVLNVSLECDTCNEVLFDFDGAIKMELNE